MGLEKSPFGIVGIELAFPIMYTHLVRTGILSMERLLELMVYRPRERFKIPLGNDFSIWKLDEQAVVDPDQFLSMGKATPFAGESLYGVCVMTVKDGRVVYRAEA